MNEITTTNNLPITSVVDPNATLLDMRKDSTKYPRVGAYKREEAVFEMSKIVSRAFLYRGQSADPTNIKFISCSLVDELQADMDHLGTRHISFAEIDRIVKRAVLTEEMFGISVSSLYKVIITYIKGEGHQLNRKAMGL